MFTLDSQLGVNKECFILKFFRWKYQKDAEHVLAFCSVTGFKRRSFRSMIVLSTQVVRKGGKQITSHLYLSSFPISQITPQRRATLWWRPGWELFLSRRVNTLSWTSEYKRNYCEREVGIMDWCITFWVIGLFNAWYCKNPTMTQTVFCLLEAWILAYIIMF